MAPVTAPDGGSPEDRREWLWTTSPAKGRGRGTRAERCEAHQGLGDVGEPRQNGCRRRTAEFGAGAHGRRCWRLGNTTRSCGRCSSRLREEDSGRIPAKLERGRASGYWWVPRVVKGGAGGSCDPLCRGSGGVEAPAESSTTMARRFLARQ